MSCRLRHEAGRRDQGAGKRGRRGRLDERKALEGGVGGPAAHTHRGGRRHACGYVVHDGQCFLNHTSAFAEGVGTVAVSLLSRSRRIFNLVLVLVVLAVRCVPVCRV